MKIPLTLSLAAICLFFAACEEKSPGIAASSPSSSTPTPAEAAEPPDNSAGSSSALVAEKPAAEASAAPSANAASTSRPVFHSEAATQAANQYLDSYSALVSAVNNAPKPPQGGSPEAVLSTLQSTLQEIGRHNTEYQNQQREVDRQLTPDEKKRLLQYQKSLEQGGQSTN
jgi:hypothetical protein